jgi:hypothetical protein
LVFLLTHWVMAARAGIEPATIRLTGDCYCR